MGCRTAGPGRHLGLGGALDLSRSEDLRQRLQYIDQEAGSSCCPVGANCWQRRITPKDYRPSKNETRSMESSNEPCHGDSRCRRSVLTDMTNKHRRLQWEARLKRADLGARASTSQHHRHKSLSDLQRLFHSQHNGHLGHSRKRLSGTLFIYVSWSIRGQSIECAPLKR